jgi:hypothetical protein
MSQQGPDAASQARLRREWQAAIATVVVGFIAAIAVAAYFTWAPRSTPENYGEEAAPVAQQRTPEAREQANTQAVIALCSSALNTAQSFGIMPRYSKLASDKLETTNVQGRYVCLAATDVAKYTVAADLVCRDLRDKRCVNLYSVTRDDGTVLYQRQG